MRASASATAVGLVMLGLLAACGNAPSPGPPTSSRTLPDYWYGVTVDDIDDIDAVTASLAALPHQPVVRVLFDPAQQPPDYATAVTALHRVGYLLGAPVDSSEVSADTVTGYVDRFRSYVAAFGQQVDVWEIGNEVNGDWLGSSGDVVAKITGADDVVRAAGGRTELTLYDNIGCSPDPNHDMLAWARNELPAALRASLDYVLISYYEKDCAHLRPSMSDWSAVFARLGALFPHAKLGFGEIGTDQHATTAAKQSYLTHYYTLPRFGPSDVGGYFWWYYAEDMVPYQHNPLWQALAASMRASPAGGS